MKYLTRFLEAEISEDIGAGSPTKPTKPHFVDQNTVAHRGQPTYETYETVRLEPTPPDRTRYAHLRGPRRTPWGTKVWSDPEAPGIAVFGPPPTL